MADSFHEEMARDPSKQIIEAWLDAAENILPGEMVGAISLRGSANNHTAHMALKDDEDDAASEARDTELTVEELATEKQYKQAKCV
ncbi:hypothetical protein MMC28_000533 [Mycoblastus sanguinarius]|nr:hypothetical protein [Mycoblastus sanguinarius]